MECSSSSNFTYYDTDIEMHQKLRKQTLLDPSLLEYYAVYIGT